MKKIIVLVLMLVSSNAAGMGYLKKIFSPTSGQEQSSQAHIKRVYLEGEIDFKKIMIELFDIAKDNQIQGLLLVIDNYGGRTTNFFMVHDLIKKITTIKPVVAFISGAALSCGYAVASAADYIIAGNLSELGAIGIVAEAWKYKEPAVTGEVAAQLQVELFRAGEFKDLYNPYKQISDQERTYLQDCIDKMYQRFVAIIAQNRSLNLADYKIWAEGKIYLAREALQLGLIDEIGTMFEVENKLRELISKRNPMIKYDQEIYYS